MCALIAAIQRSAGPHQPVMQLRAVAGRRGIRQGTQGQIQAAGLHGLLDLFETLLLQVAVGLVLEIFAGQMREEADHAQAGQPGGLEQFFDAGRVIPLIANAAHAGVDTAHHLDGLSPLNGFFRQDAGIIQPRDQGRNVQFAGNTGKSRMVEPQQDDADVRARQPPHLSGFHQRRCAEITNAAARHYRHALCQAVSVAVSLYNSQHLGPRRDPRLHDLYVLFQRPQVDLSPDRPFHPLFHRLPAVMFAK